MAESVRADQAADDLVDLIDNTGLLSAMGYGSIEHDRRLEKQSGTDEAELLIRSFTGGVVALIGLETPSAELSQSAERLKQHVQRTMGRVKGAAILTNGRSLQFFDAEDGYLRGPAQEFDLADLTNEQASFLYNQLSQRHVNWGRQLRHLCT
jgi:hypothetical protein